jgi:FMN-dependent NADH-azoreductase
MVIQDGGNVGIGTTSPQSHLIVADSTTNPSRGVVASQNNSGAQAALMQMTKSRGTQTSPGAVVNGDYVGAFNMNAYDGTSYLSGKPMAGWGALVNGTVATGSIPTDLFFYTKPSGTLDPYGDGVVRVVISSAGNVGIGTTSPSHLIQLSGGAYSNGTTWVNASDRNLKENFTPLDENEILNRLETVPIQKWNYKNEPQANHIGPVAQDFYAAYKLGDSEKSIGTVDAEGIAFAAIKALHKTVKEQQEQSKKENEKLQERIAILERTVKQFAAS